MSSASSPQIDRAYGVLLGLAAGDRNGGPLQMALRLAQSLHLHQRYDMTDVAERYLAWWQAGAFDTGAVFARVMQIIDQERKELDRAVAQAHRENGGKTAGCNPAHRASPIAMAAFVPDFKLTQIAGLETAITHWDPLAGEVAAVVVELCRKGIRGMSWEEARTEASYGRSFKVLNALELDRHEPKGRGGFAPEVLQASAAILNTHQDFKSALEASLDFAGPANYSPVLVGALGGAFFGASAIADSQLSHLEPGLLQQVHQAARHLADSWATG